MTQEISRYNLTLNLQFIFKAFTSEEPFLNFIFHFALQEKERKELASSVQCYLKDNPESIGENASNRIIDIIYLSLKELNQEFIK